MTSLLQSSVFLHILAACIWIGGSIFLAAIFIPLLRHPELGGHSRALFGPAAKRFRVFGWICLVLLVVTGFVNLSARGINFHSVDFWRSDFGMQVGLKLILAFVIVGLSLFHDFVAGPRAVAARSVDPEGAVYRKWRGLASWVGRINLLLSLVILWLAVDLFH